MMQAGTAWKVINNSIGRSIQGATVNQVAETIRDDCEANALLLKTGDEAVLLVSCDLVGLEADVVTSAREAMGKATGIPERNIIIAGTHTHSGPSLIPTSFQKPLDADYIKRLRQWLVELAEEAVSNIRPCKIGWGLGTAQIGYNRRCCWADSTHTMHGDTRREDFTGLEGPDDSRHLALFAVDADGKPIAVLYNNTTHPTCFYGANFYSADFPGLARTYLRQALGDIGVLYFNGAFGDISIENQLTKHHYTESSEQKVSRAACLTAGETLRLLHETVFHDNPTLLHLFEDVELDVRLPDPELVKWAKEILARVNAGETLASGECMRAHGIKLLNDRFGGRPVDVAPVHAIRIGDVGLITQPCELYCQFGLDIKRRSPAPLTGVAGIADGYNGYCATTSGIMGGGYSGEALYWTRLAADAGYRIVETSARLLNQLWKN